MLNRTQMRLQDQEGNGAITQGFLCPGKGGGVRKVLGTNCIAVVFG